MAVAAALEKIVAGALVRAGFSGKGLTLVVGVSGGPDSSTLLHCLCRLQERLSFKVHLAHLNHDFRGSEADDDAEHVAALAHGLGVDATIEQWDPEEFRRHNSGRVNSSFEDLAREMRYSFLGEVAASVGAAAVVVGHTGDDQAETVLLHLLRGSGLHGLAGMTELSPWPWPGDGTGFSLFRPLLAATKSGTVSYCRELGISFREDSGNYLPRFTRVRVRRRLLPLLEAEYNPRVKESLIRLARTAAQGLDFLEAEAGRVWPQLSQDIQGSIYIGLGRLREVHPALQALILRRGYQALKGDTRRLNEAHIRRLFDLCLGAKSGLRISLPQGINAYRTYFHLVLSHLAELPCPLPELDGEHPIEIPGDDRGSVTTSASGWRVSVGYASPNASPDNATGATRGESHRPDAEPLAWTGRPWTLALAPEVLKGGLILRSRRPGDRFQPLGMEHEKKLQDFFSDSHTPRSWRDRVPLLVTQGGIAGVVGHRAANWALGTRAETTSDHKVLVTLSII
jgi:tRNA(Ile)-lysidine synthase